MTTHTNNPIYTIGHSTHTLDYFKTLLQAYDINCVVDVRQTAVSSYNPQYNEITLKPFLHSSHILYLHMGNEFGARPRNPALLDDEGKADFDKIRQTPAFLSGIERLKTGLKKGLRIALMCSQADPFDCHRFALIAYHLTHQGVDVKHILKDKSCINNSVLENLLLEKYAKKLPQKNLFNPHIGEKERLEKAYRLKSKSIAYKPFQQL